MSEGLASSTRQQPNYGSTNDRVPDVAITGTGFSPTEMFDLSEKVTANIYIINTKRKDLEQHLKTIGTPKDSQDLRSRV